MPSLLYKSPYHQIEVFLKRLFWCTVCHPVAVDIHGIVAHAMPTIQYTLCAYVVAARLFHPHIQHTSTQSGRLILFSNLSCSTSFGSSIATTNPTLMLCGPLRPRRTSPSILDLAPLSHICIVKYAK